MRSTTTIALATLLGGCIASSDETPTDTAVGAAIAPGATTRSLTLRTAVGAQYVSAENGGGGALTANRAAASTWETFTLYDLNGGTLQSGDLVALGSLDGHFVCAEDGGGGSVNATRTDAQDWESFRVVKIGGTGTAINDGDQIALQTKVSGLYVSAINGGGAGLVADRTAASGWEAFVVGGAGTGGGGGGGGAIEYAPYFYTWGFGSGLYAFNSLVDMKNKGGPAAVTLAFVLSNGGCETTSDIQNHMTDVRAYIAAGGHVKASFGGASGTYLENACSSASALAGAITRFVDATGITDLDFDLEHGSTSSNATVNALRATALKQVQTQRGIRVAFTLPVGPGGLEPESMDILRAVISAGVQISFVNGMTMDYGAGTNLGTTPIQSTDAVANQIRQLLPSLTLAQAYRMTGATPMIGRNDDGTTFSLDNARTLINYARQKQLGLVSFWAIQRDQPCPGGTTDLDRCSRSNAARWDFHTIFNAVTAP